MTTKQGASPFPVASSRPTEEAAARNLAINVFPVTLNNVNAQVWVGAWKDAASAEHLQGTTPGLVTWRDPDDGSRMYAWHPTSAVGRVGDLKQVTVALDESPRLFQRLLDDSVERRLTELGFTRRGLGFVNLTRPSLLAQVPALSAAAAEPIGIYPKIMVDVFFTKDAKGSLVLGIVVDILYATRLDVSAAEWAAAGLSHELPGRYVVLLADSEAAVRFPNLVGGVIGCLDGLRGDRCVLRDTRDPALVELPLSAVAPEPSRWNLNAYLAARYKSAFANGEAELTRRLQDLVRPARRHSLANTLVRERLVPKTPPDKQVLQLLPGVTARIGEMVRTMSQTFPVQRLVDPTYSFDRAGNKFDRRVDTGLQKHGPYDTQLMARRPFRLLVLAPAEHEGQVKTAVQKLLGGVQTRENVFTGLRRMYRLESLQVTYAFAKSTNASPMTRYAEALTEALENGTRPPAGEPKFHLVLTVIREEHRELPDSENPYFQTKAQALVVAGVPTQAITIEKLRKDDYALQYVLNTMAVACYGKLGGTSHVLRITEDEQAPTELVFGVGRAVHRATRFGEARETIGFTTVFRANGEYLYNDCTPYCDEVNYERAFEETIRRTVERVASFENLPNGAPLRLVFHVPRRAGKREERAIMNAVGKLPRFRIDFALVHINDDHPFQLFDLDNKTPVSRGRAKPAAALLTQRGLSVSVGPRERLVTFVGVDQYRGYGLPAPLRITLDKRSTFTDIDYLCQQIFLLSFMNAGSLTPGVSPVTIAYAEKLADLTGKLRGVMQWTVELIQQKLGRRLWFI